MNTLAPDRLLPARVRRRVTAAYVSAALCLVAVGGVLALAAYGMLWQPARAPAGPLAATGR
ncbi:hypothetical protein [Mumia sp. DW29H23]|uniref:hypothetical protein n=1 Tax=Mumia sp. DW29H23 TaxID=3421241 RepID=UPI003D68649D